MHKQREEDRISGALTKPSAEDEFDSRVRESEVRKGATDEQTDRQTDRSVVDQLLFSIGNKRSSPLRWRARLGRLCSARRWFPQKRPRRPPLSRCR